MTPDEYERRVEALILSAQNVLTMFRAGYNPTEAQLNALENGIFGLTMEKRCGHRVTEDCDCEDTQ